MFEIQKNVPIPTSRSGTHWPFANMEVGDMVEFPEDMLTSAQAYAHAYGHKQGKKFTTRKTESGGLRVWRVK